MRVACLIFLIFYLNGGARGYYQDRIKQPTSEETQRLGQLKTQIEHMDESSFYNYHLMCTGYYEETRVNVKDLLVHRTIPAKYYDLISRTLEDSHNRKDKCPKWTNGIQTDPKSGDMDHLVIDESTQPGQVVYLLSASDPERKPIYYFLRKAEDEQDAYPDDDIIFSLNPIKMGKNWYAEVRLNKKLDSRVKANYLYLVNAYDGKNIIEHLSHIQVVDNDPNSEHGIRNYNQYYHHQMNMDDQSNEELHEMGSNRHLETVTKPNFVNNGSTDPTDEKQSSLLFLIDENLPNKTHSSLPSALKHNSIFDFLLMNTLYDAFKFIILIVLLTLGFFSLYFFVLL